MPESITVKGKPGLYLPLGSPFASEKFEGKRLEDLINRDAIKKMMNSGNSGAEGIEVYEASPDMAAAHEIDPETLTYLAEYQLADMPLDLQAYMDQAMAALKSKQEISIPDIPPEHAGTVSPASPLYIKGDSTVTPNLSEEEPFLRIPLNDMGKLVKKVTKITPNGRFGLKIPVIPKLKDNLRLKIPALGIPDYIEGTIEGNNLLFVDDSERDFNPREQLYKDGKGNYELWIYAQIFGACEGVIEPAIVFDWNAATIDTEALNSSNGSSSTFSEVYKIGNNLGEFLGGGAKFKKVLGYVYMTGMGTNTNDIEMTVGIGNETQKRFLQDMKPTFTVDNGVADGSLTTSSFTDFDKRHLELTPVFDNNGGELKVDISIKDWVIYKNTDDIYNISLKCWLFALIPLDLKVIKAAPGGEAAFDRDKIEDIQSRYVMLMDLGDMLKKKPPEGEEGEDGEVESDLFGRKPGEDNALQSIARMDIGFSKSDINIIDPGRLVVLVQTRTDNKLMSFSKNAFLRYPGEVLNDIPFSPKFYILLEKDKKEDGTYENFGSFMIKGLNNPRFDFRLYVEAKTALQYTLGL
jgi:hypothetical protein